MSDKNLSYAFYGDQVRWFIGVVEEIGTDEPRLGRVRVRIYGIHDTRDKVPISDLPQAQVLIPTTEPGVSGMGRNPYLEKGATVFGIFLDGKASQLPLVLGSIPVIEVPSGDQLESGIGPTLEKSTTQSSNSIFRTGNRTANNNTATISSAKYGGADLDPFGGAGRPITQAEKEANVGLDAFGGSGRNISTYEEYPSSLEERKQMAWEFFTERGWSPAQAAGIIGNLIAESNLVPAAKGDIGLHAPTDVSIGIAQWYSGGGRDKLLFDFARSKGKPWSDYRTQLEFVDHELNRYSNLGGSALKNTTNPTSAALIFQRKYEIPALTGGTSPIDGKPERLHEDKRVKEANDIYNSFTRST